MRLVVIFALLMMGNSLYAQESSNKKELLQEARNQVKSNLQKHLDKLSFSGSLSSKNYEFLNSDGHLSLEGGFQSKVQFIDESGFPVFYAPFNLNAAKTTGADMLQPGGSLGLNLTGKGLTVGIFDQTRPKPDHVEFGNRLTQIDGSSEQLSTHATHVSGTVLASGVNPQARGMAYEATGWSFNWDADVSKMNANAYDPDTKPNGMLISNHSYGIVLGWRFSGGSWTWFGNPSVDPNKDWRFGFYSTKSQAIDELLFTKPYYSVVWSAGNDRNDVGDGTRDPDGPDDTIGPEGVAKNNFTIGAVEQVLNYTVPEDVKMSNFSSWGPVDDGRIKPDLVAMGVNVFSASISNGQDSYASQSGTSMAAPNATGSMFLLQQLYSNRNSGRFMLSSALKALTIHTAKEAGPAPGPDYMYGWGLLDVNAAAKIILNEDGSSSFIREEILGNKEVQEFEFVSDGVTPIRATIAWTDPAGTPQGTANNPSNLMLVNDLDLRIFDEDGKEFFPWTLDPTQRAGARGDRTKDNFRDNVEQVFIESPQAKKYRVRVSHKGDLKFDIQQYSIVFTAGVIDGSDETLYWIGGTSGDWNNGANWSSSVDGPAVGRVPKASTRVVFEGTNSGNTTVSLDSNVDIFSLNFFGNQIVTLDLKGNQIDASGGLRISNQITTIKNGEINFSAVNSNPKLVELSQASFENVKINFLEGNWKVLSGELLDDIIIDNAKVEFDYSQVRVNSFTIVGTGELKGSFDTFTFKKDFIVENSGILKSGVNAVFSGTEGVFNNLASQAVKSLFVSSGKLTVLSEGIEELGASSGEIILDKAQLTVGKLKLGPASVINLSASSELVITDSISSTATLTQKASIKASGKGKVIHDIYRKYCFEHISVSNVDLSGDAIINLGVGAELTNSSGWLQQNCGEVLFANFKSTFPCAGAAVNFENLSEGNISTYLWDFGGLGESSLLNPFFVFDNTGEYLIKLTVSNAEGSTTFERSIQIGENTLQKPVIVVNGTTLTSQTPGSSYQWYLNGEKIPGATNRSLEATGDGSYQVAIFGEACNRVSDPVVISAIPDQEVELSRFGIFVGPIPSEDQLKVTFTNSYSGPITLSILDMAGRVFRSIEIGKNTESVQVDMNLPANNGLYILRIKTDNLTLHKKVIKQ
ncbi:S8 family serine peptidase [Algoriphagus algorifonticola]|uniref:S8 family serine peptidase n=1 Tax=Algoriphagus algorifonticola TaxID=2593007 RepID=UPI00119FAE38|nr:S8 family serine peptidase [Algoriphagus algorifonticola]